MDKNITINLPKTLNISPNIIINNTVTNRNIINNNNNSNNNSNISNRVTITNNIGGKIENIDDDDDIKNDKIEEDIDIKLNVKKRYFNIYNDSNKILVTFNDCHSFEMKCPYHNCMYSNKYFTNMKSFHQHHIMYHQKKDINGKLIQTREAKWQCPKCFKISTSWYNYSAHVTMHKDICDAPWICSLEPISKKRWFKKDNKWYIFLAIKYTYILYRIHIYIYLCYIHAGYVVNVVQQSTI